MPNGLSIHIALNEVDARHYGSEFPLAGCMNDATAMCEMAKAIGFETSLLTDRDATTEAVLGTLRAAASRVRCDDFLFVSFSGHGLRVPDLESSWSSLYGWEHTWCLFDRMLLGLELREIWADLPANSRVLVVSDCCFAAGIYWSIRGATVDGCAAATTSPQGQASREWRDNGDAQPQRTLKSADARKVYGRNRKLYEMVQAQIVSRPFPAVSADVLLLAACRDCERARDGDPHGLFTGSLLNIWDSGGFQGDYVALHTELLRRLAPTQYPVLLASRLPSFIRQRPFTI
ncbi:MAG TPA: caspase family protein [Longimicrobium sp.]|nr:caspase family protein [Longimicrobium sp.]